MTFTTGMNERINNASARGKKPNTSSATHVKSMPFPKGVERETYQLGGYRVKGQTARSTTWPGSGSGR
ncbi:hypothetical protein J3B00_002065 [Pseudomonas sp. BP8]|nr:hypothetical protein [Pseudomonas sp. BP8]